MWSMYPSSLLTSSVVCDTSGSRICIIHLTREVLTTLDQCTMTDVRSLVDKLDEPKCYDDINIGLIIFEHSTLGTSFLFLRLICTLLIRNKINIMRAREEQTHAFWVVILSFF